MADFKIAYAKTMVNEGGYANDPNDRGGETWKGIARKMHPDWPGWVIIDACRLQPGFPGSLKTVAGLQDCVFSFYKSQFWDIMQLDQFTDQRMGNELFDTGVNMGTGIPPIFLQRALNVTNRGARDYPDVALDGKIGPKTIGAVNNHPRPLELLKVVNVLQGEKYIAIAENNPSQEDFMASWMSRVFEYCGQ